MDEITVQNIDSIMADRDEWRKKYETLLAVVRMHRGRDYILAEFERRLEDDD